MARRYARPPGTASPCLGARPRRRPLLLAGERRGRRLLGAVGEDEVALDAQLAAGAALQRDVRRALGAAADRGHERGQRGVEAGERLLQVGRDRDDELAAEGAAV